MDEEVLGKDAWRKSSYSGGDGACTEVAATSTESLAVRDSKDKTGPWLILAPEGWRRFTHQVKKGEFDVGH